MTGSGLNVPDRIIYALYGSMWLLLALMLLSGCLGSISVKELDAVSCGTLSVEDCEALKKQEEQEVMKL